MSAEKQNRLIHPIYEIKHHRGISGSICAPAKQVQQQARVAYQKFQASPGIPGLQFKKIHSSREIYSIRITQNYRAAGVLKDNEITWFWMGSHAEYNKILKSL